MLKLKRFCVVFVCAILLCSQMISAVNMTMVHDANEIDSSHIVDDEINVIDTDVVTPSSSSLICFLFGHTLYNGNSWTISSHKIYTSSPYCSTIFVQEKYCAASTCSYTEEDREPPVRTNNCTYCP